MEKYQRTNISAINFDFVCSVEPLYPSMSRRMCDALFWYWEKREGEREREKCVDHNLWRCWLCQIHVFSLHQRKATRSNFKVCNRWLKRISRFANCDFISMRVSGLFLDSVLFLRTFLRLFLGIFFFRICFLLLLLHFIRFDCAFSRSGTITCK